MPEYFNKRLIVLLVSIIVLVALIGYSLSDRDNITMPEQFLRDSVGWVQTIFSKPAHYVAGFFENVNEMKVIYEENRVLKARLEEFAQVAVERNLLKSENDTLRRMLEIDESLMDYQMRTALVIQRSPDRWNNLIGISKGKSDGIRTNMAVMTSEGFIGKVKSVGPFTSTVQLITDHDRTNRVSAMIHGEDSNEVLGFIEGYDQDTGLLLMKKITMDREVEIDQLVTTSGKGGIFPSGLPIGKVVAVEPDEYGLTQNAYIEPAADFYRLEYVFVIERTSITLDEELQEEEEM
ncbi:rod shape-determining protein MreC [Bacillus alkalicellulosilyticus]|uniref:rod shape-determining protein MreC n=1 Tax=Alkalihalobacterium alkalicellulosilyticum TaxID=1912214 RepID=UPI000996D948|nr:rod shape-determining protein MreC [Bacillus alkalicellulosilyticus]